MAYNQHKQWLNHQQSIPHSCKFILFSGTFSPLQSLLSVGEFLPPLYPILQSIHQHIQSFRQSTKEGHDVQIVTQNIGHSLLLMVVITQNNLDVLDICQEGKTGHLGVNRNPEHISSYDHVQTIHLNLQLMTHFTSLVGASLSGVRCPTSWPLEASYCTSEKYY